MEVTVESWCFTWLLGALPLVLVLIFWGNDLWYVNTLKARCLATGTKLPPGYMGIPFFGEFTSFIWYFKVLRRPDEFINSKRRRYGDNPEMYRTYLFRKPSIIVCSPEFLKFILQRADDKFPYRFPNNDLVGHHSIISVQGNKHKRLRRFVSEAINHPNALNQIAVCIQPRILAALKSWVKKGNVETYDEARKMTFENIGKLFASLEPGSVLDDLCSYFDGMIKGIRANPLNFPGTSYHFALKCRKKLIAILRVELEKKKKKMHDRNGKLAEDDLMDALMQLEDEDGRKLTDEEVLDNIASLVVGGYESVSVALTWAMYYLAKHPDVLHKIREENMGLSKDGEEAFLSRDDLRKLTYTNKVVDEIIRCANVAVFIMRSGDEDVDYKGYKIPKGWKVFCWLRYANTDERNYDDPLCFNPERWSKPANSGNFFGFGGGSRSCVADRLAKMQIGIFLHHLSIGNYRWKLLNPDAKISYLPNQKPVDGVKIFFSKD